MIQREMWLVRIIGWKKLEMMSIYKIMISNKCIKLSNQFYDLNAIFILFHTKKKTHVGNLIAQVG